MAFLSLGKTGEKGMPIALVRGGDHDGEILSVFTEEDEKAKKGKKPSKREIDSINYAKDVKHLKPAERVALFNKLSEAKERGVAPEMLVENEHIRSLYRRILSDHKEKDAKTIELPDDSTFNLIPNPDPEKRSVYYVAGASGSGKSYIARGLAEGYKKLFPDRQIYLISKLTDDSTLDTMKVGRPLRIDVNSLIDNYPKIDEFQDCMVIFDDYDCFTGKEGKVVQQLIDDLSITGRHTNTTCLFLTHYITNYKKTALMLNEAMYYIIYPQSTSFSSLRYLLASRVGMSKEDITELRKMGRWVCIYKNYPQFLVSQHIAKILHQEK
jgi:hypothetical protein